MKPDPPEVSTPPQATDVRSSEGDHAYMEIELDVQAGLVRVVDARLFQPARRGYARRLVEALCEHPGVRKAEVDLATSTCRVEFDLAANTQAVMAAVTHRSGPTGTALPVKPDGGSEARPGLPSPPFGRAATSRSGKRTRTSRGAYGFSIADPRTTAPGLPVSPTAWRVSKGSSDVTCRSGRTGSRSIAVRARASWPDTRWTAWSISWRREHSSDPGDVFDGRWETACA